MITAHDQLWGTMVLPSRRGHEFVLTLLGHGSQATTRNTTQQETQTPTSMSTHMRDMAQQETQTPNAMAPGAGSSRSTNDASPGRDNYNPQAATPDSA
jgi:hypothetical protein